MRRGTCTWKVMMSAMKKPRRCCNRREGVETRISEPTALWRLLTQATRSACDKTNRRGVVESIEESLHFLHTC